MNYTIRNYKNSDHNMISDWWFKSTKQRPFEGSMIENGTFILELNNIPVLCLTILLTQTKEMAYISNFVKNPEFKKINLEEYGKQLWNHCFNFAQEQGYKRVICFAKEYQLKEKYQRFGMTKTLDNLSSFVKEL